MDRENDVTHAPLAFARDLLDHDFNAHLTDLTVDTFCRLLARIVARTTAQPEQTTPEEEIA